MSSPVRCVRLLAGALALSTAAAALRPGAAGAQEVRAIALMEAAAARYAQAATLCADFTQHLSVPLLGDERTGRGRLCQERPDRFAMRFVEPEGDLVVVDGAWVWVYYPSMDEKQVIRLPMARAPGGFDFHREFLERPAEKYRASYEAAERIAGRETHRIRLIPRQPASYQAAVVWIDAADSLLRQVRVEEENGSVRTVTLTRVELGAAPPPGWFTFVLPPGAQVIGG